MEGYCTKSHKRTSALEKSNLLQTYMMGNIRPGEQIF